MDPNNCVGHRKLNDPATRLVWLKNVKEETYKLHLKYYQKKYTLKFALKSGGHVNVIPIYYYYNFISIFNYYYYFILFSYYFIYFF
jgi:hypothetical protein